MIDEQIAKVVWILMNPTHCAARTGTIRPKPEAPLMIARLGLGGGTCASGWVGLLRWQINRERVEGVGKAMRAADSRVIGQTGREAFRYSVRHAECQGTVYRSRATACSGGMEAVADIPDWD